jgi:hypothetical protein
MPDASLHPTPDPFDAALARAMNEVPVPSELATRLHAAANSVVTSSTKDASTAPDISRAQSNQTLRHLLLASCAIACLTVAWNWLSLNFNTLTEADVRRLATMDTSAFGPVSNKVQHPIPAGWNSVRGLELAKQMVANTNDSPTTPLRSLTFQDQRAKRVEGLLLAIPASKWSVSVTADPFSQTEVRYLNTGTWAVWREEQTVFVLLLRGNASVMEHLQHAAAHRLKLT